MTVGKASRALGAEFDPRVIMRRKTVAEETVARQRRPPRGDERPGVSYLVRFWVEPRETGSESGLFRGYARDLRTGEERYFGDPQGLSEHIERRLQATLQAGDARSETGEAQSEEMRRESRQRRCS